MYALIHAADTTTAVSFSLTGWQLLTLLVGTILPLVVGLVTTRVTNAGLKAILLLALSAVIGLLGQLIAAHEANQDYDLGTGLVLFLGTFLIGVGTHFGLWKPTGVTGAAQDLGSRPEA